MKKLILTAAAGTAALALAACDARDEADDADTTVITEEPAPAPLPTVTETPADDTTAPDVEATVDSEGNMSVETN